MNALNLLRGWVNIAFASTQVTLQTESHFSIGFAQKNWQKSSKPIVEQMRGFKQNRFISQNNMITFDESP